MRRTAIGIACMAAIWTLSVAVFHVHFPYPNPPDTQFLIAFGVNPATVNRPAEHLIVLDRLAQLRAERNALKEATAKPSVDPFITDKLVAGEQRLNLAEQLAKKYGVQ